MDALFELQAKTGQRIHEDIYEALFRWPFTSGVDLPCVHGEIVKNPPLVTGGYSPNIQVTVTVRQELFPGQQPRKDDLCRLKTRGDGAWLDLKIGSVIHQPGDLTVQFVCVDAAQGA